jgi:hydrogenase maturation protease
MVTGVLVVGIGNDYRQDDAAGLEIARRVRTAAVDSVNVQERAGDIGDLIDSWSGLGMVILVDAVKSGASAGSIFRFDAHQQTFPEIFVPHVSSHGLGVAGAIGLAQALGRMPPHLIIYGLEGSTFEDGIGLSPPVEAAIAEAVGRILADICSYLQAE